MQLTKTEFADLFGLKHDSFFLDNFFSLADTSGNNLVNMRECLDFFLIFTEGRTTHYDWHCDVLDGVFHWLDTHLLPMLLAGSRDDKIRLLFDMYDIEHEGRVNCDDIKHMLK